MCWQCSRNVNHDVEYFGSVYMCVYIESYDCKYMRVFFLWRGVAWHGVVAKDILVLTALHTAVPTAVPTAVATAGHTALHTAVPTQAKT